ncbi:MAG: insulinase family protein [Clostridia bacterium]|nr:insulinase family protein [Clostridia bacterium]
MIQANNLTETKKSRLLGEEYTLIRHKSGLDIYVVKKDFSATYAVFGTRYGSLDNCFRIKGEERPVEVPEGIAHFLEHKMFEMEDGRDAFELYAETGAEANAYTSIDRTAYLFSCTSDFETNLRTLLRMVTSPFFTEQTVKKEQGIIGEEIRMCEDRPWDALHYGLMRAVYKAHPVRIPITGTVESIAEITPELLYNCYNTFYNLRNMALCICGNVDVESVAAIADEMLEIAPSCEIERILPEESPEVDHSREIIEMQVSKPMFSIGVKDCESAEGEPCHYEAVRNLLCESLFGMSGDLYSELYESGAVGGYGAAYFTERDIGLLNIYGDCDDPEAVFEKFREYAERVAQTGVSEEQFIRARRVLYAQTVRSFESSSDIAEAFFSAFAAGQELFDYAEEIYRVTKEEVDMLARRLFRPERYAMCVLKPVE